MCIDAPSPRPLCFYIMDFSSFDLLPNSGVMLLVFTEMSYLLLSQSTFLYLREVFISLGQYQRRNSSTSPVTHSGFFQSLDITSSYPLPRLPCNKLPHFYHTHFSTLRFVNLSSSFSLFLFRYNFVVVKGCDRPYFRPFPDTNTKRASLMFGFIVESTGLVICDC
jgi:hypothetical protein